MKVWITGCALILMLAVGVKSDYKDEFKKMDMACRAELHVSDDEMKAFLNDAMKSPASVALKCHTKCVLEKQGVWSKGGYDSEAALKQVQEFPHLKDKQKELTKMVVDCKDQKGSDECDTAYLITKCFLERFPGKM